MNAPRLNQQAQDILDDLRHARRRDPLRGWVHGQMLSGIGGNRYGARLDELRAEGYVIESKSAGSGGWKLYRLGNPERQARREKRTSFDLPLHLIRQLAAGNLPQEVVAEARRLCPAEQVGLFGGGR